MPRLALYSDQRPPLTDAIDDAVRSWLPPGGAVGYLPSAPDPERAWFEPRRAYYGRLGLPLRFFGVEDEFDPARTPELLACDAIHLTGGNTFQFLYWLRERGLMDHLRRYAQEGGALIGVSAGAILATPEVGTSLLCGDVPHEGIDGGAGLGLVDFAFAPHFDGSDAMTEALLAFSRGFGGVVHAVPDGGGIVVDGDRTELIGDVVSARSGSLVERGRAEGAR